MFDIDDALIKVSGEPIAEMVTLYKIAETIGYKMIIITARPFFEYNANYTVSQLLEIGINPNNLYFTSAQLKGKAKLDTGYNFVLSVGDQWTDLTDTHKWIKLPDSYDSRIIFN